MIWTEYGCPVDLRSVLPWHEYQAHLAVLRGRNEKREEEMKKAQKKARRR